jgi:hypothetical protein
VTQNRVPGATGNVTITSLGTNQIRVDISITGLPASPSSRAAHIHTGPGAVCDNGAPVTYPLTDVMVDSSGHGTSTTMVTLTADKPIMANNAYVNVHEEPSTGGTGAGVICANITQSYTAGGTSGSATGATAPSGTSSAATATSGQCVAGDSWCAYCSTAPSAAGCQAFTPAHASGTTATGAMGKSNSQPVPGVTQGLPQGSGPALLPVTVSGPFTVPITMPVVTPVYIP